MAKGLRSSSIKTNHKKLRSRVFGPVETARTERLSAKLLELASQPKPARAEMDLDVQEASKDAQADAPGAQQAEEMDIDGKPVAKPASSSSSSSSSKKKTQRHKVRGKPRNTLRFSKEKLKPYDRTGGVKKNRVRK